MSPPGESLISESKQTPPTKQAAAEEKKRGESEYSWRKIREN